MIKEKLAQLAAGVRPDLLGRIIDRATANKGVELSPKARAELRTELAKPVLAGLGDFAEEAESLKQVLVRRHLATSSADVLNLNLPQELPPELSRIATEGGHEIQSPNGKAWLTWGENSSMRGLGDYSVLETLFPSPTIMKFDDGRDFLFSPSPMPSYISAFKPSDFDDEKEAAQKFYEQAVSAFVDEDTGHVDLGKQHRLIAVDERLEKQLRITGRMVAEGPLAAIRGVLQVWFVETAHRLGKRIEIEPIGQINAEEEVEDLWDDAEFLWNDFKTGRCGDDLEERLDEVLFRQDTPATLASHTKIGLLNFIEWRDQLLRYAFSLDRKYRICESMLLSADMGALVPGWEQVEKDLRRPSRRDTRAADKKLESAKRNVAITLLIPADAAMDERFVLDPRWKGKSEKSLFKEVEKEDRYQRKWDAIKRQLADNIASPPLGRGAEKWEPHAQKWAKELSIPPFLFENRKN